MRPVQSLPPSKPATGPAPPQRSVCAPRELSGGSSLAQLLAEHCGVRNRARLPALRVRQIVQWAKAYYQRTGSWPTLRSGAIAEAPGETWGKVHDALYHGGRGQPGGSSLAGLPQKYKK